MSAPAGGHVVVVGAVNVDLVVAADRLPGPGETVVGPRLARHGGGKGANAAVAARRAGARVHLVGAVGDDDLGAAALAELRDEGVVLDGVQVLPGTATGTALVVTDPAGENQIAVAAGANHLLSASAVEAALSAALRGASCLLVSTEVPLAAVGAALLAASRAGVACVLNPAPVLAGLGPLLGAADVLTPNRGELADLADLLGLTGAPEDVAGQAALLGGRAGTDVLVTLGSEGALLVPVGGDPQRLPSPEVRLRDSTGAGDTVNGVLAAGLASGQALRAAARTAVVAAALSVEHDGARTGMPTAEAIAAALGPGARAAGGRQQ